MYTHKVLPLNITDTLMLFGNFLITAVFLRYMWGSGIWKRCEKKKNQRMWDTGYLLWGFLLWSWAKIYKTCISDRYLLKAFCNDVWFYEQPVMSLCTELSHRFTWVDCSVFVLLEKQTQFNPVINPSTLHHTLLIKESLHLGWSNSPSYCNLNDEIVLLVSIK